MSAGGTDYGRPPEFGYFLTPEAGEGPIRLAREADRLGLDLIGVQDHPYQRRFADTLSLIATLLARTERVRIFPDVASLPLRPPATLAKAFASMDVLSGGRTELGLGGGAFWDAIVAYGGPRRTPGQARAALAEAIEIIRLIWSGGRGLRFEGEHYTLAGAQSGPVPAHPIGIWLGVAGPRALELAGRAADGWVPSSGYVPPERLAEGHARVDEAAEKAGREPSAIRRIYNVMGTIGDGASRGFLDGPPDQWVDELTDLVVAYGMDAFIYGGDPAKLGVFAAEIAPAVREQVARERG